MESGIIPIFKHVNFLKARKTMRFNVPGFFLISAILSFVSGCANTTNDTGNNLDDSATSESIDGIVPVSINDLAGQTNNEFGSRFNRLWIQRTDTDDSFGIHFSGEAPEVINWGPKNFTVDLDGTFWIADTVVEHIIHADRQGSIIGVLDVSKDAVGAAMAQSNGKELAVISVASQPPRALRYSMSGELLNTYDLPMEWQGSVTGIEISDDGTITVQREHGYRRHPIVENSDGSYEVTDTSGITWDLNEPSEFDRFVVNPVDSRNSISLRRFMGEWNNTTYVYVEEWRDDEYGQAVVDSTVRKFNEDTEEIGVARVNIRDRYTFIDLGGIQYDTKSGKMLTMMTRKNGLGITALKFVKHLDPLEDWGAPEEVEETDDGSIPVMYTACISGSTMISNISPMAINAYSSSSTDAWSVWTNSASCTRRTVPHYLTCESFFGVPYAWGKMDNDTVFTANMYMPLSYYKAGDIWTSADQLVTSPSGCGSGVDCSGLVTIAWGRTSKLGTYDIASTTYTSSDSGSWDQGEVYVKGGTHVVTYYGVYSGSTYYWYESTIDYNYDRAIMTTHPTSYWSRYSHRRYVNQCS